METWKRFLFESEEVKNLQYGELTKDSHIKMNSEVSKMINLSLSDIPIENPPENDSDTTKKELSDIMKQANSQKFDEKTLEDTDKRFLDMFIGVLKDNDKAVDHSRLKELSDDVARISLKLKMRHNRPRPEQLGPLLGYDISSIKTDTDNTPSYPSGHTMQAWTLATFLSKKYPDIKKELEEVAKLIEDSRIVRGAHYASDNEYAKKVVKNYIIPNIGEQNEKSK